MSFKVRCKGVYFGLQSSVKFDNGLNHSCKIRRRLSGVIGAHPFEITWMSQWSSRVEMSKKNKGLRVLYRLHSFINLLTSRRRRWIKYAFQRGKTRNAYKN